MALLGEVASSASAICTRNSTASAEQCQKIPLWSGLNEMNYVRTLELLQTVACE